MDINEYISKNAEDKDNASESKSHIQMTTMFGSIQIREWIMNNFVPPEAKVAHNNGLIYIHDLSHIGPYCNSIDPSIPLSEGLNLPTLKANPAKHFGSALDHLYSYAMYSQNHFGGAQSIDWFNWFMAPYLFFDGLSYKEAKQELQKFFFNCNQITRTGGKPPFTNIGLRMECPSPLKNRPIIYNGKKQDWHYKNMGSYARRIYRIIMEILRDGMAGGIPFTYPLVATTVTPETDFNTPEWEETMITTAKNGSVYFVNTCPEYMQTEGADCDIVSSQCCRVRVKFDKIGGIWSGGEMGTGTNRIVTLNLAAVGYEADGNITKFYDILDDRLALIKKTLISLNEMVYNSIYEWGINSWLAQKTPDGIPYYDHSKRRLLIGTAFLHDMAIHMGCDSGIIEEDGNKFAREILRYIKNVQEGWMEDDPSLQWGIEAPPNESSNHFMAKANINHFAGTNKKLSLHGMDINDIEYVPATHVPYDLDISIPDRIHAEEPFHELCDGGNILLVWMGEGHPNPDGLSELIQSICKNTKIGYFALSPDFTVCEKNHCVNGKHPNCQICGSENVDYMSRVTGYIERVSKFNDSKRQEWQDRFRHDNITA